MSIQTHQQRGGGEEGAAVEEQAVVAVPVEAPHMKWALQSPKVLPVLQKLFRPVRREKREGTEIY